MGTTECSGQQWGFSSASGRTITAEFNGGTITSDGGSVLLGEVDRKLRLLERFGQCFLDGRDAGLVKHSVEQMARQRVYALALGYEDVNDHDQLRHDPLLAALCGKRKPGEHTLAGKSTMNRLERGTTEPHRYRKITFWKPAIDDLLVDVFLEAHAGAPAEIVLDIDTTDVELHGRQEDRFFHGFYGHYCYLPLYVFCGSHVLCARLRPAHVGPAVGAPGELERIVTRIRAAWPEVRIILRGDSGFANDALMTWCEQNHVDFVLGLARNPRLQSILADALVEARQQFETTRQPARVFSDFMHQTVSGTWTRKRRVVAKAEHIADQSGPGKSNPRFVVTSLDTEARQLYERIYCARGDMENRIKEQFQLFAGRASTSTLRANQLRLYFSVIAYTLMDGLRSLGLRGTSLASAQPDTIRLRLLKIGALVRVTVRRVWVRMASAFPLQDVFSHALLQLRS